LRRFLDAFRVEIHYDVRTRRATLRAEISGPMPDRNARAAHAGAGIAAGSGRPWDARRPARAFGRKEHDKQAKGAIA
jgi:hypothetical protein